MRTLSLGLGAAAAAFVALFAVVGANYLPKAIPMSFRNASGGCSITSDPPWASTDAG